MAKWTQHLEVQFAFGYFLKVKFKLKEKVFQQKYLYNSIVHALNPTVADKTNLCLKRSVDLFSDFSSNTQM